MLPRTIWTAVFAIFIAGHAVAAGPTQASMREPAKSVDLNRYSGRWFEQGRYEAFFQRGCERVTADYKPLPNGELGIVNTCRTAEPKSGARSISGLARVVEGTRNTKLKVSFFGPFFLGDYWILDHARDYSWSIVGEGSGQYLWILTRSQKVTNRQYRDLLNRAAQFGYDADRVRRTMQ